MNDLAAHIHHYFSISHEDSGKVAELFRPETLEKGAYWQRSGKYCNKLSFLREGLLRVYVDQPGGEVTQWIATPGYFISDIASFLFRNTARFHIQALTDVQLFTIDHAQYLTLTQTLPKWNEFEKMFTAKCFVMMENRIFDLISLSAEERYQKMLTQHPLLFTSVPQQYLASMLGMTPETFSRIRRKLIY